MFPTLKLLERLPCPEHQPPLSNCSKTHYCPFNHKKIITTKKLALAHQHQQQKSVTDEKNTSSSTSTEKIKTYKIETTKQETNKLIKKEEENCTLQTNLSPPKIKINKYSTPHTFPSTRQKLLETIYSEYIKLYEIGLKLTDQVMIKSLAYRDSLKEEFECLQSSSQSTYRNTIISSLVKIRKRIRTAQNDLDLLLKSNLSSTTITQTTTPKTTTTTTENRDLLIQNHLAGSNSQYDKSISIILNTLAPKQINTN